jgi:hypothetical protein
VNEERGLTPARNRIALPPLRDIRKKGGQAPLDTAPIYESFEKQYRHSGLKKL